MAKHHSKKKKKKRQEKLKVDLNHLKKKIAVCTDCL